MGGTLGAQPVDGSNAGSGFSGSSFGKSSAFFAGLTGLLSRKNEETDLNINESPANVNTLGARAVEPEEHAQLKEQSSYDSMSRRAGLYDVFAPAGPIGIIVDTTKNGPAVHSLKQTSPMLGLINPGDLIVALDDEDTRGMTAATLTRLMAQKSNQRERKITLLTTE
jgi:C-terminal processing protease CtpA/Prc